MALGPLPSPGPFGRIVDVRVWPHGFSTQQGDIVRPNIEDAAWHAGAGKWGGNIVWTGSTVRHTIAYNGPRGRYFGPLSAGSFRAMKSWFAHNGARVNAPSGLVLAACVKTYDSLPTSQTYAGTGDGTLDVQTPSTATGALTGDYEIRCIEAAPVPRFLVTGPDAQPIGVAEAGPLLGAPVLFDGVVRFTLQAGSVAFVVGDAWTLTVEEAEQFVVITTPDLDATPRTEAVWRRGVSLTPGSSWRQLATIAPVSGQVGGSIQPWFFNAAATSAVTVRGLGNFPNSTTMGATKGVVARVLALSTLSVADTVETSAAITYNNTFADITRYEFPAGSGSYRNSAVRNSLDGSGAPRAQLMALDYSGDSQVRVSLEFSGSASGQADLSIESETAGSSGSLSLTSGYGAHVDIVWEGGAVGRLTLFDLSWSGTQDLTSVSQTGVFLHRVLTDIAGPSAGAVAYTEYAGTETLLDSSRSATATMQHLVAGSTAASTAGASGPHVFGLDRWVAGTFNEFYENIGPQALGSETVTHDLIGVLAPAPVWACTLGIYDGVTGALFSFDLTAGRLPAANETTGRGFQTSAQDTRGNWLMAAEVAAFGTSDMRWPGSISGSGTYTTQAGGPDALTPSLVATLTGTATDDRWDVGVF